MYLLFDIGGTNLRLAISDGKTIIASKTVPTPKDFERGIQTIKQIANELTQGKTIDKISGGIAGPLDKAKTMLVSSPHIGNWVQKPFKDELEKVFGCKVYLENDADLFGLGEATQGAGIDKNIVAFLTISTGVGGARIVNKKIDGNVLGFEPGHQIIEIDGKDCQCGGKGHLEVYVGGYYIGRNADWDQAARYLSIGLNNIIVHWSPDIVILGGSVMKSVSIEKVKDYLEKDLTIFPKPPEIVSSKLGDEGGLYGALAMLL